MPFLVENATRRVAIIALLSRMLVLALALVFDLLVPDYDTSATLDFPCLNKQTDSAPLDGSIAKPAWARAVAAQLEGMVVWDSVFFMRIAKCGYEFEQMHAFFPLLPLCLRLLRSSFLLPLVPLLGERATTVLGGLLLSNLAFVGAAIYLYKLSLAVLQSEKQALLASLLFCLNPASVFYSAVYSESLFALLSFAGLWQLSQGATWQAAGLFMMSGAVRSNGLLHCGFFLFQAMHKVRHLAARGGPLQRAAAGMTSAAISAILKCAVTASSLVAFQWYGYSQFCRPHAGGQSLPGEGVPAVSQRPWCKECVPYLYGFVQSHYWNVGFLRYFQLKQAPNFLLASPMLLLAMAATVSYARRRPCLFFSLGFCCSSNEKPWLMLGTRLVGSTRDKAGKEKIDGETDASSSGEDLSAEVGGAESSVDQAGRSTSRRKSPVARGVGSLTSYAAGGSHPQLSSRRVHGDPASEDDDQRPLGMENVGSEECSEGRRGAEVDSAAPASGCGERPFFCPTVACFLYQLIFMTAAATLVMHVQVATRFLSVSPPIYWYGAHVMLASSAPSHKLAGCDDGFCAGRASGRGLGRLTTAGRLVWLAFLGYTVLGSLLFVNFYPFT